jgi:hypothetical protein
MVLHQKDLPEASLLYLMAGGCQLLLQHQQQEDRRIKERSGVASDEWNGKMKKHTYP